MDHKERQSDKSYQGKKGPQIRDPSQKYGSDSLKSNQGTQPDQEKECGQPRKLNQKGVSPHQHDFSASVHNTHGKESVMVDVHF